MIKVLGRRRVTDEFDGFQPAQIACKLKDLATVDIGLHRCGQTPGALGLLQGELLAGTCDLDLCQIRGRKIEHVTAAISKCRPLDQFQDTVLNGIDALPAIQPGIELVLFGVVLTKQERPGFGFLGLGIAGALDFLFDHYANGCRRFVQTVGFGVGLVEHVLIPGL